MGALTFLRHVAPGQLEFIRFERVERVEKNIFQGITGYVELDEDRIELLFDSMEYCAEKEFKDLKELLQDEQPNFNLTFRVD